MFRTARGLLWASTGTPQGGAIEAIMEQTKCNEASYRPRRHTLAHDERGAVSTEYVLTFGLLSLVTVVALATLATALAPDYAAAPVRLQTATP